MGLNTVHGCPYPERQANKNMMGVVFSEIALFCSYHKIQTSFSNSKSEIMFLNGLLGPEIYVS